MEANAEERRQARAQQKAKAAARKKWIWRIGLVVAGAAMLTGIILLIVSCSHKEPAPEIEVGEDTVLHFVAGGDLTITDQLISVGEQGYDAIFQDVAPLIADADLSTINLEGNLAGAPYGTNTGSAPISLAYSLQKTGMDMVQLANSFSNSRGPSGLNTTIDSAIAAGLEPVGVFKNSDQFEEKRGFSLFEIQGVRIAVVAFTKGLNGMSLLSGDEDNVNLLYKDYDSTYQKVDTEGINALLDDIDREMPDIVIALVHWGSEFNDNVSSTQKSIIKLLQGRGVDAIIGTHPHYVQKLELNEETGQFLAYSLGSFVPSYPEEKKDSALNFSPVAGTEYSILLDLEITKFAATGEARITGYSYTPLFSVSTENSIRVVRLVDAMAAYENNHLDAVSKDIYDDMVYAQKRIEARVKNGS